MELASSLVYSGSNSMAFFLHSSSMFSCGLNRYVESQRSESWYSIRNGTQTTYHFVNSLVLNKHTLTLSMFKQRAFLLLLYFYLAVFFDLEEKSSASLSLADLYRFFKNDAPKVAWEIILACNHHKLDQFFFHQKIFLYLNLIFGLFYIYIIIIRHLN